MYYFDHSGNVRCLQRKTFVDLSLIRIPLIKRKRETTMNRFLQFFLLLGVLGVALAGCAVGPTYERPDVDVPAAFKEAAALEPGEDWKAAEPADDVSRGDWWTVLNDAKLNTLQEQAMAANQDLKAAASRVKQARALS